MSAASYEQLRCQQVNVSNSAAAFYEARKALIAYRSVLQNNYHAKEAQALMYACSTCIDKLQRMINGCNGLKDQLIYAERMEL